MVSIVILRFILGLKNAFRHVPYLKEIREFQV
jgi:hypothetical protein